MSTRKQVVIIGGGFGGVYTAAHLEKSLGRCDDFQIHLVNRENYFVFQPMLAEIISGSIGILDGVIPLARMLKRTLLHLRDVEEIDLKNKLVKTTPGFNPVTHSIPYDYLVLAPGMVTHFRGMPGMPEHAIPFKNLSDALFIRNHTIRALEEANIETDPKVRQALLTFVIAGGGFSGVECAADLNDFVRITAARHFRNIPWQDIRVILLHSQDRILPEVGEKLGVFAQTILQKRGVDIRLKTRLTAASKTEAVLGTGERILTRTLISTVPSSPNPIIEPLDLPKDRGRLKCNAETQVEGSDHIWALGDCALIPDPNGTGYCPPTAQHGMRQGAVTAHNIVAAIRGGKTKKFTFKGLGKLCSLGHQCGVGEIFAFRFSGLIAWFVWRSVYLMKLPSMDRRIKVAFSWFLDFFFPPDLVELKIFNPRAMEREHYETGQDIIRKGHLSQRIYFVVAGKVRIFYETEDGQEQTVGEIGSGEYFGERAVLNKTTHSATARTLEPTDVLALRKEEFESLTVHLPELRKSFEKKLTERTTAEVRGYTDAIVGALGDF